MALPVDSTKKDNGSYNILRLIVYSLIGIVMFFVPVTIGESNTILLDHIVNFIKNNFPAFSKFYVLVIIISGGLMPFIKKTYNKDSVTFVFSILKLLGIVIAFMAIFNLGPKALMADSMIPFLFNKLVIPVGMIVPVGAVFLAFLIGYGLLESIGVLMQPIMKPIFKTPGKSAIDAVASFVGSYSIALLITNKVYKEGKYSAKEAFIIATGFSTVSASFMIVVAKTLGLMDMWNFYFWSTLGITFAITAITVRIKPTSSVEETYYNGIENKEEEIKSSRFKHALKEGLEVTSNAPSIFNCIKDNLFDGIKMTMGILPTILSVGLLGLVLADYTKVFDVIGYVFYPITSLLGFESPLLVAKASALSIAEMFLPAMLIGESMSILTRYVIGVISISSILFFSASIPCILSTEIPIKIKDIVIIWFERLVLGLILATLCGYVFLV